MRLRIATRQSKLAIWQAEHVASLVRSIDPSIEVELVRTSTSGDRNQQLSIAELGGKAVFAADVQTAVLEGHADLAVHSAKDLRSTPTAGLQLVAIPRRGEARDVLIGSRVADLPIGATIGTGSLRRRSALALIRSDLQFVELRGNIETRLRKANEQELDAIVLAGVALERLGLDQHIAEYLSVDQCVPQVGQGALAVEVATDRDDLIGLLQQIEDPTSRFCVDVERSYLAALGGDCRMPTGAYATITSTPGHDSRQHVTLVAMLASEVGGVVISGGFECPLVWDDTANIDANTQRDALEQASALALNLQAQLQ